MQAAPSDCGQGHAGLHSLYKILIQGEQLDVNSEFVDVLSYEQISEGVKAATVIVSTLPVLMMYPFLQKYFVTGLMIGSLKE